MKKVLCVLTLALVLACAMLLPGHLLEAQEQGIYGSKVIKAAEVDRFTESGLELIGRLEAFASHAAVVCLETSLTRAEKAAWVESFQRELAILGESSSLARNLEVEMDLAMGWKQEPDLDMIEIGELCAVDLETGESFLLEYLLIPEFDMQLVMDVTSEKLISIQATYFMQALSEEEMAENAQALAGYLGLVYVYRADDLGYVLQDAARTGRVEYWIDWNDCRMVPMWP